MLDKEVTVVGASPVGLGRANENGQWCVESLALESKCTPSLIPEGQNLTQWTLERFHFWKAEQVSRAASAIRSTLSRADHQLSPQYLISIRNVYACRGRWFTLLVTDPLYALQCLEVARQYEFPWTPRSEGVPDIAESTYSCVPTKFLLGAVKSYLTDWTVDLASNDNQFYFVTKLTDTVGEFPRIDDRFAGIENRYGWVLEMDTRRPHELKGGSAGGMLMNCLFLKDLKTAQNNIGGPAQSPPYRSHASSSKHAPEGDGWIVQVCNQLGESRSDLLLFDALEIEKGPIATVHVPIRLGFGLHGNFAPS